MFNSWHQTLTAQQAVAAALANSSSQTSVLNGQAKFTIPAQGIAVPGEGLRIRAAGVLSTAASAPGTLSWFVMYNAIAIYAGGASGTLATNAANAPWELEIDLLARSVGSGTAATFAGSGKFFCTALSAATPIQILAVPGPLTGFDSTVAGVIDLQAQFSVANASNSITCHKFDLTSLN